MTECAMGLRVGTVPPSLCSMTRTHWHLALLLLALASLPPTLSGCAGTVDRIADRAGRAAERAVNRQVDRRTDRAVTGAIDGAFNVGENAVRCVFNDDACIRDAQSRGEDVVLVDADGSYVDRNGRPVQAGSDDAVIRGSGPPAPSASPLPGVSNSGYDFTPGPRALFEDDFERTRLGNVPGSVRFISGEMDVVDDRGNKVLRVLPGSIFAVPMGELPELFTLEFDLFLATEGSLCITTTDLGAYRGRTEMRTCNQASSWMSAPFLRASGRHESHLVYSGFTAPSDSRSGTGEYGDYPAFNERYVPVRATMDGTYLKVYFDDTRIVNIPNVDWESNPELVFFVEDNYYRSQGDAGARVAYLDNMRVGAGGQETGYASLSTGGRVTARGILFDSGSARLAASSESELQQLLTALESDPGLRVRIEGHTDASGSASTNQRLSQQRAESVRAWLTARGIAASRLEAVGYGEDRPVADNETASGREQNRRVEIVGL